MLKISNRKAQLLSELKERFVDMLYATQALKTKEVEGAFRSVPRHLFVDRYYDFQKKSRLVNVAPDRPTATQLKKIYCDDALVSHRNPHPTSSTSQPSLVAQMLEQLQLKPGMKVLEIGAGTGWNAALMGHIVGSKGHVYSIDIQADVARRARRHVRRLGAENVTIITADGGNGYRKGAPYDRIITTVSCPDVSPHWMDQLKEDGALLITLQDIPGESWCLMPRLWKRKDHLEGEVAGLPGFMELRGKYGMEVVLPEVAKERLTRARADRKPRKKTAPWICWNPGMRRWMGRGLLFFVTLEGMFVEPAGRQYILSCRDSESICITDEEHIEVYGGEETYRAFEEVARKWIEVGAPRRSAYRMEVWPKQVEKQRPKNGWLVQRAHSQLIFRLK